MADTENQPATLDPVTAGLAEQGFAVVDNYPANLRLRAEALYQDGKDADPAGWVTAEQIEQAGERLAADEKDATARAKAEKAETPSMSWTREKLVDAAEGRGLSIAADAEKADILSSIQAAPAVTSEG